MGDDRIAAMTTLLDARLHATISGTVQGVGFRYSTLDAARRLGLTGWVRNLRSGEVEVVAEGKRVILEQFREYLAKGPIGARVTGVDATWETPTGEYRSFSVTG